MCIAKDSEGFMWFGSWDGINRFDGHNFTVYKSKPGDTSSLKNNRIDEIVEGGTGYLWLRAYDNQIYRFDKKSEKFLSMSAVFGNTLSQEIIFEKIVSLNGGIWATTHGQGVFHITNADTKHPGFERFAHGLPKNYNLPSNFVTCFHEDKSGIVWIGTTAGIGCLKKDKNGHYITISLDADLEKKQAFSCIAESDDQIYLGTADGTLFACSKLTHKVKFKHIAAGSLNALCVSKKNKTIYASTSAGDLLTVNSSDWQVSSITMAGSGSLLSIYEDRSGLLWIEPQKHGVIKFDPAQKTFKYYTQKKDASYENFAKYYKVFEDANGLVWISMKGEGFGYYDRSADAVQYFHDEPGSKNYRFSNLITCTYFDPAGILWLNADDKGLNKVVFSRNEFNQKFLVNNTYTRSDNEIRGIYNDRSNRLWLASKSGKLYVYQNDKQVPIRFLNEPKEGFGVVYNILEDKAGSIWLGTKGNGLFKAEPVVNSPLVYKISHYLSHKDDPYSLNSNVIYTLTEDKKGRIWVGTYEGGVNQIDESNHHTRFINSKNDLTGYPKRSFKKIRCLQEDGLGNIWIGTTDGLLILNANAQNARAYSFISHVKIPGDKTSLGKNDIQFIYRDLSGGMWLSTSGGGLNKAIEQGSPQLLKFKVYTNEDGLPSDYILSTVEDNRGNLWIATENGLSKYDIKNDRFKNYDSYDGLPKSGFSEASNLRLPDGKLIFGCIEGYVSFNPDNITDHKINAKIALTNLQINNEDVTPGQENSILQWNIDDTEHITLRYNQNILGFDYSLLDFRSGNKQVFAYRLNGFDKVWRNNKGQRRATYTNLAPGDYKFEVKSSVNDLYSNKPYKSINLTILPPPWRTWWAYIVYFVLACVLAEVVRRIALTMLRLRHRISVEKKLADLKLSFFTNVSHELRTPLTLILNPIEEIYQKESLSVQGVQHIQVVQKNARRMVRFINQLLDLRKVQSGKAVLRVSKIEVVSFVQHIAEYFKDVAIEKEIDLQIISGHKELYAWLDVEKIDIVIYNLMANAFKFSPAKKTIKVIVSENKDEGFLLIEVYDQGNGVVQDKLKDIFELFYEGDHQESKGLKGTGIGLALSKELIDLHHGAIAAQNNADKGLTVTVKLLLGKAHFKQDEIVYSEVPEVLHELEETMEGACINTEKLSLNLHDLDTPLVLLVEDNADLRAFLTVQLNELYRVEVAENGKEGLSKAIKLIPDMILSDVMMPVMDGIQMLDQIKNNINTSHIPVILLTARHAVESQIEGLTYGADYYITKPFNNQFLLASIANLLKQRKKMFSELLKGKKIDFKPSEIVITSQDEIFLKRIIEIVEQRMPDPEFNIDEVADSMNMSRSPFYKKFKGLTNMAPVEFVREMRLKRSKQLLDAGEHNITSIAYAVGFSNAKYFSTCFKEQFQLSPTEYLKQGNSKTCI